MTVITAPQIPSSPARSAPAVRLFARPQRGVNTTTVAVGLFILATAAYYGYEAYSIFANRWVDPSAVT